MIINWVEWSLHRSVILPNFSTCMFILSFNSISKSTSKLTLSTQTSLFCMILFRYLSSNQLSGTIPSWIGNLIQLQILYVHSCFQFRQQTHINSNSFYPNFSIFVWLCSDLLIKINWVERSLHRLVILPNFSSCMFILTFHSASRVTSTLTL